MCLEAESRTSSNVLTVKQRRVSAIRLGCGIEHDRDENASKNIEMVGMGQMPTARFANGTTLNVRSRDRKTTSVAELNEA